MDYDNLSIDGARVILDEIENRIEIMKKEYNIADSGNPVSGKIILAMDHRNDMQLYANTLSGMLLSKPVLDESSMCIPVNKMMYCRIEKAQNNISAILEKSYGHFK